MEFEGTVSCVGVVANDEKQFLLLTSNTKRQPLKFFFVVLDQFSSALVSPFFEHSVLLTECEGGPSETQLCYTLTKWCSQQFRIPTTVKDASDYAKEARDIVRHSLFPLMLKPKSGVATCAWQRECFNWNNFRRGLSTEYPADFSITTWLEKELTATQFWPQFNAAHPCEEVVKGLGFTSTALIPGDMGQLYNLLEQWKDHGHIAGYLKYRLLDMTAARRVAKPGIREVRHASLSCERLRDLDTLYKVLSSGGGPADYKDFNLLIGHTVRPGALQAVINHFEGKVTRQAVVESLILRKIVCEAEERGKEAPSTIYPMSVKTILYQYHHMFGLKGEAVAITLHEEAPAPPDTLTFEFGHGEEIVNRFLTALSSPEQWSFATLPWRRTLPPFTGSQGAKPSTTLCYVATKEVLNGQEESLRQVVKENLHCLCEVHESPDSLTWDVMAEQRHYETLDDVDRTLYDLRMTALLYRPVEMTLVDPPDLATLHTLMAENIFTCSVIRPKSSDYTLRRVAHYFSRVCEDIPLADLHTRFSEPEMAAPKELVILVDCHLLSITEMLALFRWFQRHKGVVRRLVMMGASDTLPLRADGQAWLDLLSWFGHEPPLFRYEQLNASMDELLEQSQRRLTQCPSYEEVQSHLTNLLKRRERRPDLVCLHCLVGEEEAARRLPSPDSLQAMLEAHVNIKYRTNQNLRLSRLTLAEMTTLAMSRDRQVCHLFFATRGYVKRLTRNDVNHLLMALPPEEASLTIVCEEGGGGASFGWLRKASASHPRYPNSRFTLAYLAKLSK
jgi:hypothetical protein